MYKRQTKGSLEWHQTRPDEVRFAKAGEAAQLLCRAGDGIDVPAGSLARVPFGHPEGYYIAIANIYRNVIDTILKLKNGETPTEEDLDFPDVETGVSGVKFYYAVMESAQNNSKWVDVE